MSQIGHLGYLGSFLIAQIGYFGHLGYLCYFLNNRNNRFVLLGLFCMLCWGRNILWRYHRNLTLSDDALVVRFKPIAGLRSHIGK